MARIRIATIGVALILATATAGAQQDQKRERGERGDMRGGQGRGARGQGGEMALFKGITLTETQRAQIREIRARYRDQFDMRRDSIKAGRPKGSERQRPDSVQRAQRRAQAEAIMAQNRVLRERELAEMRAVLTPDQRVIFDRNVAEARARMDRRADRWEDRDDDDDDKRGKGHQKGRGKGHEKHGDGRRPR